MIRLVPLLLLLFAVPVSAQERHYVATDFDRVRIDGAFDVQVVTHRSPGAVAEGPIAAADLIDVRIEGNTAVVRSALRQSDERPTPSAARVTIRLYTADLRSAIVIGGGKLEIVGALKSPRLDLQVTGSGSLTARQIANEQLGAVLLGAGSMTLGGRASKTRISVSGAGGIDGAGLTADDLILRLDGPGTATVAARYTADVFTTGVGAAIVLGMPACRVKAQAGGPIVCGKASRPESGER